MGLNFGELHCTAQGNHGDEEDYDGEDVDGFVEGLGDVSHDHILIARGISRYFLVDFRYVHPGALPNDSAKQTTLFPVEIKVETGEACLPEQTFSQRSYWLESV